MRSGWKRGWILLAAWAILLGALAGRGAGVSQQADRGGCRGRARRRNGHDCAGPWPTWPPSTWGSPWSW